MQSFRSAPGNLRHHHVALSPGHQRHNRRESRGRCRCSRAFRLRHGLHQQRS
ncbi:MAG: hypothetical protein MZV64_37145 [Ignavibacteriales bacterium]|nr:hypothetical protein [Ignavibacteriales bacterium]